MSVRVRLVGKEFEVHASDSLAQADSLKTARDFVKLAATIQEPPSSSRSRRQSQTYNYDVIMDGQKRLFAKAKPVRIVTPPGSALNSLADFFCSPKTIERVVRPIISDLQTEYCTAVAEGRICKAKWICIRSYVSFWSALGLHTIAKKLIQIRKISKLP